MDARSVLLRTTLEPALIETTTPSAAGYVVRDSETGMYVGYIWRSADRWIGKTLNEQTTVIASTDFEAVIALREISE